MRILCALLLAAALLAPAAYGQVPKGVIAEDATATWCVYCPAAYQGLEIMKSRYDANEFTSVRYYSSSSGGHFATAETDARIAWYGVTGFPTVMFDGSDQVVGGGTVVAAGDAYEPLVSREIGIPSPLKITINSVDLTGPTGSINFDVQVAETMANIANVKIRAVLLENDIYWCCGAGNEDTWIDVTRDIMPDVALNVSQNGQVQNVVHNFAIDPTWNDSKLWMAILIQNDTGKYILQSTSTRPKPAYSIRYWAKGERAAIAPSFGDYSFQDFAVYNLGTSPDVIRMTIDPGSMPAGWTCTCSDGANDYTGFVDLALNPGESRTFHLKVTPHSPGYCLPKVILTSANLPGVQRVIGYNLVTDDVQVLVVDDDGAATFENYYTDALSTYGATYGVLNRNYLSTVSGTQLQNFPVVFWEIGLSYPTVTADDRTALSAFLDAGGKLFITGQDLGWEMNDQGGASMTWYHNYLHADYVGDDANHYNLTGVAGDPISNGMTLVIQGGDGANNQEYPEEIKPRLNDQTSSIIFSYDATSWKGAIKADTGTYKVVYLGFGYEAISTQANRRLLVQRILQWFGTQPAAVGDGAAVLAASVHAFPNPAAPGTTLRCELPAAGPARLDIFALDGSLVRTLMNGVRAAGVQNLYWDGRNNAGDPLPSGVYFYRLEAGDAVPSGKLILTR